MSLCEVYDNKFDDDAADDEDDVPTEVSLIFYKIDNFFFSCEDLCFFIF